MTIIKEYKQFFLRDQIEPGGLYPDQEIGFPIEYYVELPGGGQVAVKNRFLTGYYPSEEVFEKLFESIPFKLNVEDTAALDNHGLVKVGTAAEAAAHETHRGGYFLVYPLDDILSTVGTEMNPYLYDITFTEEDRTLHFVRESDSLHVDTITDLLYGDNIPQGSLGKVGDVYVNTKTNNDVFLKTGLSTWIDTGMDFASPIRMVSMGGSSVALQQTYNGALNTIYTFPFIYDGRHVDLQNNASGYTTSILDGSNNVIRTMTVPAQFVVANTVSGGVELYNGSVDSANYIATISSGGGSSPGGAVIYNAGVPSSASGSDGDTCIDTVNGVIYEKVSGIWNNRICFSKCGAIIEHTFKAKTNSININNITDTTTIPVSASDSFDGECFDPSGVWAYGTYTSFTSEDSIVYVSGQIEMVNVKKYHLYNGTWYPTQYCISISSTGSPSGDQKVYFYVGGLSDASASESTEPVDNIDELFNLDFSVSMAFSPVNTGAYSITAKLGQGTTSHTNNRHDVTTPWNTICDTSILKNVEVSNIITS